MAPKVTYANPQVLDFYKTLPFNYYASVESQAESIVKDKGSMPAPALLSPLLENAKRILDVGCGAGWFSNLISHQYRKEVVGIDFNPVAIERAQAVSAHMKLKSRFFVQDLFTYVPELKFDLVVSLGVLHHTNDCQAAIRHVLRNTMAHDGYFYLGLYHTYGRAPFLNYFRALQEKGESEQTLFEKYKELHSYLKDETHLRSWFRDQVLHPHETQHSLAELMPLFDEEGAELISTSINKFGPVGKIQDLFELEKAYVQRGTEALAQKRYFPGFFAVLVRKTKTILH